MAEKLISAQEAATLSGLVPKKLALFFAEEIKRAALNGHRYLLKRHGIIEQYAFNNEKPWKEFVFYMSGFGYEVSLFNALIKEEPKVKISW